MSKHVEELVSALREARPSIEKFLRTTDQEWRWASEVLKKVAVQDPDEVHDEKLWTWLLACGYAAGGPRGVLRLAGGLTGLDSGDDQHAIWFEVQPPSPRRGEGNTHLDLALGDLALREGTDGGIQPAPGASWVCFWEMKWYSDLSTKVTHDLHRNQLAHVIENAVAFASAPLDQVHVVLVTPRPRPSHSRWMDLREAGQARERL